MAVDLVAVDLVLELLQAVDLVAVDLVLQLLQAVDLVAVDLVPVFVFVSTWCPVFVIRWPRSHTLGPRAVGRVAWAVGRVARFARRAARGLVPE